MSQSRSSCSLRGRAVLAASAALTFLVLAPAVAAAQDPPRTPPAPAPAAMGMPREPQFVSAEVMPDRRIAFRIYAPRAQAVRLSASDIPGLTPAGSSLAKADTGVWEVTVGPVSPGAYRYAFSVDGVSTTDPRSPAVSESNGNAWSLVIVPGSDVFDTKDVPHGAVSAVTYHSSALGIFRRMQVYTPPGYELGAGRYPVFYLLHGAGDNDHSWSTVGRAGIILDNLIAAKKARPMIVVMPAGHTPRPAGAPAGMSLSFTEDFGNDFVKDVMPYVESHYRVLKDRANTAIAGLSMGGYQTLSIAIPRLDRFAYIGVFSSGLFGAFPNFPRRAPAPAPAAPAPAARQQAPAMPTAAEWEKANAATLDNPALKKGLRLFWFATGKEDFLLATSQGTVDLLKKHGFDIVFNETSGAHTWVNWRDYLAEFAPKLFQEK